MEERDNTPLLDLNVSLEETMLDNGLDCLPHCDTEKIEEHILDENGDLGFSIRMGHSKRSSDGEIRKRVIHCSKEGFKQRHKRSTPQKERSMLRT
ncbi:hypothetical protein MKW92_045960 [Papaver armeniacum]|nr:hypothetical protein MKW92_045960 [Papaver armeniacum]